MGLRGCCCCGLRGGTKAIGVFFLVCDILYLLSVIVGWIVYFEVIYSSQDMCGRFETHLACPELSMARTEASKVVAIAMGIATAWVMVPMLFNSLLIHGVDNDRPGMILAWLIFYGIVFGLFSLGQLAAVALAITTGHPGAIAAAVVFGFGVVALVWFWWAVVITFYKELQGQVSGFQYSKQIQMVSPEADAKPACAAQGLPPGAVDGPSAC